ncbi:MAG TPA: type IV pilus assembly protein PilM [Solirubrobacteraceae bacterium]|jgi:type IV pilus assembly protein PilM
MPTIALKPNLNLRLGGRRGGGLVGLDIQPGYVAAVQAHINGGITVQHAAGAALPPDAIREGEVLDERTLSDALRELFDGAPLGKRVRIGLANQRTVLRTLELPPVTDRKELAAAVRFQAEDQVPMPLANAVLDFHSLGVFDTPNGPRQRVIVVAAQREMVERLLRAVRHAGLRPEGVDLSAFALIRSLYRPSAPSAEGAGLERVLYLNIGGLTNMAIAEGPVCRFTRVVGGGLEAMAAEIAERRGIPLVDARALLAAYSLNRPAPSAPPPAPVVAPVAVEVPEEAAPAEGAAPGDSEEAVPPPPPAVETWALAQDPSGTPLADADPGPVQPQAPQPTSQPVAAVAHSAGAPDAELRMVLENGIREIVGEVRNSLDFHRSQEGGGEVASVVLSGPALEMAGFAEALEADLAMPVRRQSVGGVNGGVFAAVSADRLAIATGLAAEEAPQ